MCVFVYGWNNWDFVIFRNAAFGEIKDHSLRTTPFQKKKKYYGRFEFVSTLRKNVFWGAAVKCVFLYGSNNSDFLFSGMPLLERSKITVGAESHRSHFLKII